MFVLKLTSCIACLLCIAATSDAQVLKNISKKIENKVNQRVDRRVDEKIEEELDKAEGKNAKVKKDEDGDVKIKSEDGTKIKVDADDGEKKVSGGSGGAALAYNSKYDFVPGEKVVAFEDFNRVNVGDFPTNWNTDASAEVVTLNNKEGKWLMINSRGTYHAEFINSLPENSTLEFDMGVNNNYQWGSSNLYMDITHLDNRSNISSSGNNSKIHFAFHPMVGENYKGGVSYRTEHSTNQLSNNGLTIKNWDNKTQTFAHVSLWRQGQRLRMYVNGEKIIDLPRAFDVNGKYTDLIFETNEISKDKGDYFVLGNFRLAVGAPDTRNKLMSEGKFVTRGILFDVNSDKIKPESYGVIKEIGNVLKENPTVKVKIIGHTDTDGDDKSNLDLSSRRAAAVKALLVKEYEISEGNLTTEGKGESQPVDKNDTAEGKANNRRVEFIKI